MRYTLFVSLLSSAMMSSVVAIADVHYMVTSHQPDAITIVDADGQTIRQITDIKHPQDASIDADGRIFCSEIPGARLFSAEGNLLWKYEVPKGCQNPVAQMLGDDRFLVGNEGPCRLVEINSKGAVLVTVQLTSANTAKHGQFRFARKTQGGTYLVPQTKEGVVKEYDAAGNVVHDFGAFDLPVSAVRIENGHTVIGVRGRVVEFDTSGQITWDLDLKKDLGVTGAPVTGIVRLDNGNTVFGVYHKDASQPDLYEVSASKEIVRAITLPNLSKVAAVQVCVP